jgi:hypothetical protein
MGPARSITRRRCLQAGALGMIGLSSLDLELLRRASASDRASAPHRQNACVFIFLFGGPSHIDLWDMKPQAPAEIRGEFQPVATRVPGIDLCEHLPRLATQIDKVCLVRSMTHDMNVHGPACSEMYSGRPYFGPPTTDQASPQDWPSTASLVSRYLPRFGPLPASIVLPWYSQFDGQDKRIAGQTGGRMGEEFNPFLVMGDPSAAGWTVPGLKLPEVVSLERFAARRKLLGELDRFASAIDRSALTSDELRRNYTAAFDTVERSQSTRAFELDEEPQAVRERYGLTRFGQSLLLARRLIEDGVSLITVNWDDGSRTDKVSPFWDTHHQNFKKLAHGLCPLFDQAYSAFVEDLHTRGLLDTTLVVATGEFGRTPRIGTVTQNGMTEKTGRDHWPHAFTVLLAGGGVRGGQVYGATNKTGGYVADRAVSPADLTATMLQHLGVDPSLHYYDHFQRVEQRICEGNPIAGLG